MKHFISMALAAAFWAAGMTAAAADTVTETDIRDMLYAAKLTDEAVLTQSAVNASDVSDVRTVKDIIGNDSAILIAELPDTGDFYINDDGSFSTDGVRAEIAAADTANTEYDVFDSDGKHTASVTLSAESSGIGVFSEFDDSSSRESDLNFTEIAAAINAAGVSKPDYVRLCRLLVENIVYFESDGGGYAIPTVTITVGDGDGAAVFDKYKVYDPLEFFGGIINSERISVKGDGYSGTMGKSSSASGTGANSGKEYIERILSTEGCIFWDTASLPEKLPQTDTRAAYENTSSMFTDIETGTLINTSANELSDMGVIFGYDDGTFCPDAYVTRAETAAMLTRLMNLERYNAAAFSDVPDDSWYGEYVGAVYNLGLMTGYGDGTFRPNARITYHEFAAIAYCLLGTPYYDYDDIVRNAAMDGLTAELSSFSSEDPITRGDTVILLSKLLDSYISVQYPVIALPFYTYLYDNPEMTLADYLAGKSTEGMYITSYDEYTDKENEIQEIYYCTYSDILSEYIAENGITEIPDDLKKYL